MKFTKKKNAFIRYRNILYRLESCIQVVPILYKIVIHIYETIFKRVFLETTFCKSAGSKTIFNRFLSMFHSALRTRLSSPVLMDVSILQVLSELLNILNTNFDQKKYIFDQLATIFLKWKFFKIHAYWTGLSIVIKALLKFKKDRICSSSTAYHRSSLKKGIQLISRTARIISLMLL